MSIAEFGLIQRFFTQEKLHNAVNKLGVGDDCALMEIPSGYQLAVTTDTMVAGIHFFKDADPYLLGHKLLAVNLSDLASMGAEPAAITLALSLPSIDEVWLGKFSQGLLALAKQHQLDLIGGDTTQGALTLTVQALGLVPIGQALRRSQAQVGDLIFVTGNLGDAGLGLKIHQGYESKTPDLALAQFNQPMPQIHAGIQLRNIATACIDVSDGLAADLGHILTNSKVGALLEVEKLPISVAVRDYINSTGNWQLPLVAGDDYQLCFTIKPQDVNKLTLNCQQIGVIEAKQGLRIQRFDSITTFNNQGYEHFSA